MISVADAADMQKLLGILDELNKPHMQQQLLDDWKRKHSLGFARANVWNIQTLGDWEKTQNQIRETGLLPRLRNHWYLDQWNQLPVRLNYTTVNTSKKAKYKWEFTLTQSPMYMTPHALQRYRERRGVYVNPETQCVNIPYIPRGVFTPTGTSLTNLLLPTHGGSWLGFTTTTFRGYDEYYKYNKRGLTVSQNSRQETRHFYALSYITDDQMFPDQRQIVDAYLGGDYDQYQSLLDAHCKKNPRSIFDQSVDKDE